MPVEAHNHKINNKIDYYDLKNLPIIPDGSSFKCGNGARTTGDGAGNESITGLGFEPSCVIIITAGSGVNSSTSWGFASSAGTERALEKYFNGSAWTHAISNTQLIYVRDSSANQTKGNMGSFDSDGFTISWDEVSVNASYIWLAIS